MIVLVVLTYRADPELFDACVASVVASGDADRVVVVDNGQTVTRARVDGIVRGAGGDPAAVDLVVTRENLGYAGGMNAGINRALSFGPDAVAILNDDTVVEPGWLRPLAAALAGDRVGAAQPKLLLAREPGEAGPSRIQSVGMSVRYDGAGIDLGYDEADIGQYAVTRPISLFTGAAVLLDVELLDQVGGFDERYFLYYEDIDLARRGADAGFSYVNVPASVVHHAMSSTARTLPGLHRYWQERNRLWWLFRHGSPSQVLMGIGLSFGRLVKHPARPQAKAILDGLGGVGWCLRERRASRTLVQPLSPDGAHPWTLR